MNPLTRKLKTLEQNIINDIPNPKETYLGITNKNEQELLQTARRIIENHTNQPSPTKTREKQQTNYYTTEHEMEVELSENEKIIFDQASRIIFLRSAHIFDIYLAPFFHLNDPLSETLFYLRLHWFLHEMQDMLYHYRVEKKIVTELNFEKLTVDEQDEKLKICHDSWREWFTKESFDQWIKNHPPPSS